MSGFVWTWTAVTTVLAIPAAVLWLQIAAAAWPGRARYVVHPPVTVRRARLAVLVPAHDERVGIQATLQAVQAQLRPGDRLLVVADNCSDTTAELARQAGAEVAERHDGVRRGKGYALDHGVRRLAADPPEVLVMLDADCAAHPGTLDALATAVAESGRPAQALYLMEPPATAAGAGLKQRAAQFAWRVKNHVRPLGLRRLGGPCQLMGTGMAFPWALIEHAPLASGHLVEDMQLGIDLALAGKPPRFVPEARVTSTFPETEAGAASQRKRWEHGHLATLLGAGPRLLAAGVRHARPAVVALAVDLMIPPLALLLLLHLLLGAANGLLALALGEPAPLAVSAAALLCLGSAVVLAWAGFGRDVISLRELATAPLYALRKVPMYAAFLKKRQAEWVRAKRHGE